MKNAAKKNAKSTKRSANLFDYLEDEYVFDLAMLKKQVVDKGYISIEIL